MMVNWSKEAVRWAKIGVLVAVILFILGVAVEWYYNSYVPSIKPPVPQSYIALVLQTNNQHPLNDTLWIVNPTNTLTSTFTFYINSPDPGVAITADKYNEPNIDIQYNKTDSVYIEAHDLQGGNMQAINLTFSKYIKPIFKVVSTDAPHYCNTTLEVYVPNVTNISYFKRYNVWLNSTFGCNSTLVATFNRVTFNLCESWQGNRTVFSFCNGNQT